MRRPTLHAAERPRLAATFWLTALALAACAALAPAPARATDTAPAGENAFSAMDTNHDGCISLQEWKRGHTDKKAFYQADGKHTGCLDQTAYLKAVALSTGHATGRYLSDAWITAKVKAALVKDEKLKGLDVGVNTHQGIVQLSGWAANPKLAHRAVKIAASVEGVKGVQDDLNTQ